MSWSDSDADRICPRNCWGTVWSGYRVLHCVSLLGLRTPEHIDPDLRQSAPRPVVRLLPVWSSGISWCTRQTAHRFEIRGRTARSTASDRLRRSCWFCNPFLKLFPIPVCNRSRSKLAHSRCKRRVPAVVVRRTLDREEMLVSLHCGTPRRDERALVVARSWLLVRLARL